MALPGEHNLGHGVRVAPLPDGGLEIWSRELELPWRARLESTSGSMVVWAERVFEVVELDTNSGGQRWRLRPWPDEEAMRGVFRLDAEWVAKCAREHRSDRRNSRLQVWLLPVAPLVALAPARLQRRWARDWGFPAAGATLVSAALEAGIGALGLIQVLVLAFSNTWFLDGAFRALVVIGPVMFAEGLLRLIPSMTSGEPLGSVFGLPVALLWPRRARPEAPPPVPQERSLDSEAGRLELWSPVHRSDWSSDGVLPFRGEHYRLGSARQDAGGWIYVFDRGSPDINLPVLQLLPPERPFEPLREPPPSFLRTSLTSALACLAPGDLQERWARHLSMRGIWFTLFGAGAEFLGGFVNIEQSGPDQPTAILVLNLFFLCEGLLRAILLVATGKPVGSLLGLPMRPLMERLIPKSPPAGG